MELLAPAGDRACFDAALEAGADAVYLGLTALNARRNARNFSEQELFDACGRAHALGRKVHLTLNIDLAQEELTRAAEILEIAARLQVDAVLVRDPALLALKACFPELTYHLSTQACVASRADVEAARELGVTRVVLARELTLTEIREASSVPGIETEVFALGALCFSVSGRCLLSSWVGGRSGNRGQCTSPCRVPWTVDRRPVGTPFSLQDLSLVARVDELKAAGVHALKIEGRMKNPSWVRAAVAALRRAIDGRTSQRESERRGVPPGRKLTSAYLDGRRDTLVEETAIECAEHPSPTVTKDSPLPRLRESAVRLVAAADHPNVAGPSRRPDRIRVTAGQALEVLPRASPADTALVEDLEPAQLQSVVARFPHLRIIPALPLVTFDGQCHQVEALCQEAAKLGLTVEVNTWGGWNIARQCRVRFIAGPGLGILNALAGRELSTRGFEGACVAIEADARKVESLLERATLPCSVVVFGRPPLLLTRVDLSREVRSGELEDRRAVRVRARRTDSFWELRPVVPFDVRGLHLPGAAHLVVDLVASPDPVADWEHQAIQATRFNFYRLLG